MIKPIQKTIALALLLSLLMGVSAVVAQGPTLDPDADTTYGSWTLDAGFQPDPFILTMYSGGPIDASSQSLGTGCVGNINDVPDFRITWGGQSPSLRIFFASADDTTLVIRTPNGKYACNDDFDGLNPLIVFTNPQEGNYDIWLGSYVPDTFSPGYLIISEQRATPSNILSPLIGNGGAVEPPVEPPHEHTPVATPEVSNSDEIAGVQHFPNLSFNHVEGRVTYAQVPPVGGEHNPVWLNCGIYDQPVRNENAVHSLEHGAVWITYDPSLPATEVETLRGLTRGSTHRLLSPYVGLPSAIVISAWGYQLQVDSASDPRLPQFIAQFEQGPTTPEPGAPCSGGIGNPLS